MKTIKTTLTFAILLFSGILLAQPSFYDLTFTADSITTPYQSPSSNYVFIRSKRGAEPVKPTSSGDSIKTFKIQKIVLVFSEPNSSDIANREEYNQERWENILATYPEFFQEKTVYKNICQCTSEAGNPEFKQGQGFHVYYTPQNNPEVKKELQAETPVSTAAVVKEEPKTSTASVAKTEVTKTNPPIKEEPKKEVEITKPVTTAVVKEVLKKEVVKEEPKKEVEISKPVTSAVVKEVPKTSTSSVTKTDPTKKEEPKKEVVKEEPKKEVEIAKPVSTGVVKEELKKAVATEEESDATVDTKTNPSAPAKPKKAKDPKACRQACYGSGESDLNDFFRDKIVLTKKMRKDEVDLKLQLNVDGTVKKVIVLGDNAELNKLVEEVAKNMVWNASVKNGLTIKSEVRMTLKFDKELKGLKANDLMVNPRLGPKCMTCASDSELFPN